MPAFGKPSGRNGKPQPADVPTSPLHSKSRHAKSQRKRAADDVLYGSPSRRQRVQSKSWRQGKESGTRQPLRRGGHSMEWDEQSVTQKLIIPTSKDLPRLPRDVIRNPRLLNDGLKREAQVQEHIMELEPGHWKRTITCRIEGKEPLEVIGEGRQKGSADRAAWRHLLAVLHREGYASQIWGPIEKVSNETLQEEKNAKVDIYNYAAKHGFVPMWSNELATRLSSRSRGPKLVNVTIELPEQGIKVTARSSSKTMAETAAALKFKAEAERYQLSRGTASLVVKDSSSLNVDNARMFFDFLRAQKDPTRVSIEATQTKQSAFRAQAQLDGEDIGQPVELVGKKRAEDVAYLVAAVYVAQNQPGLMEKFAKNLRRNNGQILMPVSPVSLALEPQSLTLMQQAARAARSTLLGAGDEDMNANATSGSASRPQRRRFNATAGETERRSAALTKWHEDYQSKPELADLRQKRADLPMSQYSDKVAELVHSNTYSIIIGQTGSGKTTQVPQILLDEAIKSGTGGECNIICTQPRRIAATSVARRVAEERAERLQTTVGYQVRFDAKLPKSVGSITYCTTGILLQQIQHDPDNVLEDLSHVIIDEVHERDINIDFLLISLKKVMTERLLAGKRVPNVILMSATIDPDLFADYFRLVDHNGTTVECPTLTVPGRTFPVKEQYLESILSTLDKDYGASKLGVMYKDLPTTRYFQAEKEFARLNPLVDAETPRDQVYQDNDTVIDWKRSKMLTDQGETLTSDENEDGLVPVGLVAATIAHIAKTSNDGAILVFLPGLDEIKKVSDLLHEKPILGVDFNDESRYKHFMLHSSISDAQRQVFDPVQEPCRKIILATNIAETSVTIADVQHVVDTGKLREKQYDQMRRITRLQCTWVSKSNVKQRAGRAGRVQNGHYYALYSRSRLESLRAVGLPELLRSDLQETCLDIKAQAFQTPIREFLADAIEPPRPEAVDQAVLNLVALECLTESEELTPLGRLLASLPVHPALGKMIVLGIIFRCLDPLVILGAATEERDIFMSPPDARKAANDARQSFVCGTGSDHIGIVNAFREMRYQSSRGEHRLRDFAFKKFLSIAAYRSISGTVEQIEGILVEAGLIPATGHEDREYDQCGPASLNTNSNNVNLIKALAIAGFYPNVAVQTFGMLHRTPGEKNVLVHPSSVNAVSRNGPGNNAAQTRDRFDSRNPTMLAYTTLAKSNDGKSTFMRNTSRITPLMACLFGGRISWPEGERTIQMDDWLPFYTISPYGTKPNLAILDFRKTLDQIQAGAFSDLARRTFLADHPARSDVAQALVEILDQDAATIGVESRPRRAG